MNEIKASHVNYGLWDAYVYREKCTPEEQIAMLRKQNREYRNKDDFDCIEAILRGELKQVQPKQQPRVSNKIMMKLRGDTWGKRLVNGHTADQTGILYYLSVGTCNTAPAEDQEQLIREIFRKVPLTKRNLGASQVFHLAMDFEEANPGVQTQIAAGEHSTTVIELDSVAGLAVGDALQFDTTPSSGQSRIIGIAGNVVTLASDEPLIYIPLEGQTVDLIIGESGSHGNENADGDPDTGDLFSRGAIKIYKTEDLAAYLRHTFLGLAA